MNRRELERWEKIRSMGRERFVRKYGVFRWGLPSGILFSLLMPIVELHRGKFEAGLIITTAILSVPAFMCGGILHGRTMWIFMEWRYHRALRAAG